MKMNSISTKKLYDGMKTWRARYDELPQKKQTFYVDDVKIRLEVKPYPVKTKSGLSGGTMMEAVVSKNGLACVGQAVCIPTDEFDFAFGAKLALQDALDAQYSVQVYTWDGLEFIQGDMVRPATKEKIWKEFLKVVPK